MQDSATRSSMGRPDAAPLDLLTDLLQRRNVMVLSGAGCSTESGIPDYRDRDGNWKSPQPVQYGDFVRSQACRRRYWARSAVGWPRFSAAVPNPAHTALAALEQSNFVSGIVTQNVDGLHHRGGSRNVIDLHGRLDRVACLSCRTIIDRGSFQQMLVAANPGLQLVTVRLAPDGDAELGGDAGTFQVPDCPACGGILKPDVVFFGERVPGAEVQRAHDWLANACALLVVGSSLMVWSGFRFAKAAADLGIPVAAVNLGRTRADDILDFKVENSCGLALTEAVRALGIEPRC